MTANHKGPKNMMVQAETKDPWRERTGAAKDDQETSTEE